MRITQLDDEAVAVLCITEVEHVPVTDVHAQVLGGEEAHAPDAVERIAGAEGLVAGGRSGEDHSCVLVHELNAALRQQDEAGAHANLGRLVQ